MLNIGEDWYIFYHRQTNRSSYARQACAEKLQRTPEGGFRQAEVTSCGLNGGPLRGKESYEARIACNLWAKNHETGRVDGSSPRKRLALHPYFTQSGKDREGDGDQYIANMHDGATAGFRYFLFDGSEKLIRVTGRGEGMFTVTDGQNILAQVKVNSEGPFSVVPGTKPLYFICSTENTVDFIRFEIC